MGVCTQEVKGTGWHDVSAGAITGQSSKCQGCPVPKHPEDPSTPGCCKGKQQPDLLCLQGAFATWSEKLQ